MDKRKKSSNNSSLDEEFEIISADDCTTYEDDLDSDPGSEGHRGSSVDSGRSSSLSKNKNNFPDGNKTGCQTTLCTDNIEVSSVDMETCEVTLTSNQTESREKGFTNQELLCGSCDSISDCSDINDLSQTGADTETIMEQTHSEKTCDNQNNSDNSHEGVHLNEDRNSHETDQLSECRDCLVPTTNSSVHLISESANTVNLAEQDVVSCELPVDVLSCEMMEEQKSVSVLEKSFEDVNFLTENESKTEESYSNVQDKIASSLAGSNNEASGSMTVDETNKEDEDEEETVTPRDKNHPPLRRVCQAQKSHSLIFSDTTSKKKLGLRSRSEDQGMKATPSMPELGILLTFSPLQAGLVQS